ncbi:MAG: GGDEF domain-containing protein [Vicinamibacteria bacterium]
MERPGEMMADSLLRIHSSLEAPAISAAVVNASAEFLGGTRCRVLVFLQDDYTRVRTLGGDEDEKPILVASLEGRFLPSPAETDASGTVPESDLETDGAWRALIPLSVADEALGILDLSFERSLTSAERKRLNLLARALSISLRNAQTFEKTRRLNFTDHLTALYNSRFMTLYLDRELKRCRRTKTSLTLLFMDLDGFKSINDTHGHLAGSRTLIEVGGVLEKTVRDADVLIRYGGDEFVILFPETPLSGGMVIAERIRQVIEMTTFLESQRLEARISASIGIAAYPESADDVRSLIANADRAMYRAKSLGKNQVVAASPLNSPIP